MKKVLEFLKKYWPQLRDLIVAVLAGEALLK